MASTETTSKAWIRRNSADTTFVDQVSESPRDAVQAEQLTQKRKRPATSHEAGGRPSNRLTRSTRGRCEVCQDDNMALYTTISKCCSTIICHNCLRAWITAALGEHRVPKCPGATCTTLVPLDNTATLLDSASLELWTIIERGYLIKLQAWVFGVVMAAAEP